MWKAVGSVQEVSDHPQYIYLLKNKNKKREIKMNITQQMEGGNRRPCECEWMESKGTTMVNEGKERIQQPTKVSEGGRGRGAVSSILSSSLSINNVSLVLDQTLVFFCCLLFYWRDRPDSEFPNMLDGIGAGPTASPCPGVQTCHKCPSFSANLGPQSNQE